MKETEIIKVKESNITYFPDSQYSYYYLKLTKSYSEINDSFSLLLCLQFIKYDCKIFTIFLTFQIPAESILQWEVKIFSTNFGAGVSTVQSRVVSIIFTGEETELYSPLETFYAQRGENTVLNSVKKIKHKPLNIPCPFGNYWTKCILKKIIAVLKVSETNCGSQFGIKMPKIDCHWKCWIELYTIDLKDNRLRPWGIP